VTKLISISLCLLLTGCRDMVGRPRLETRLKTRSFAAIVANKALLDDAVSYGAELYARNTCSSCHGRNREGNSYWCPPLNDDEWIWGGSNEDIFHTIKYGVRQMATPVSTSNPLGVPAKNTRYSIMPRFDTTLIGTDIAHVTRHVLSWTKGGPPDSAGSVIYAAHCASCHGRNGEGNTAIGAPRLIRHAWIQSENPANLAEYIRTGGYVTTSRDIRFNRTTFARDISGMPSWGHPLFGLRDGQIKAVTLFLTTNAAGPR
jgi:cbb3-type cytochrome c oxidase subunit III